MDINFHYFAIKTLALRAGFKDNDAQTIAYYSQMIDDFNIYRYLTLNSVREDMIQNKLAKKVPTDSTDSYLFNTVTTGFSDNDDLTRLSTERYQRTITTPFHFITQTPIDNRLLANEAKANRYKLRVQPATLNPSKESEKSLIQDMLIDASNSYISKPCSDNLIKIGMLLHIFADTYAHQEFSGFWGWENHSYLTEVRNNTNNEIKTYDESSNLSNFSKNFQIYYHCPSIGHTNIGHIPDLSYMSFKMKHKVFPEDKYSKVYERNNTEEFLKVSKEILNYFRQLLKIDEEIDDTEFFKDLKRGFLLIYNPDSEEGIHQLEYNWSEIFKNYTEQEDDKGYKYNYNKNIFLNYIEPFKTTFWGTMVTKYKITNDDFFTFSSIANSICSRVNADENILSKYFEKINYILL